ncbi:hypothetical protein ACFL1B_02865 [Nanoarchaeota archaeon]
METIEKGCPFCKGDVRGSADTRYYCENCNILFRDVDLKMTKVEDENENIINEN